MSTTTITVTQRLESFLESNASNDLTYRVITRVSNVANSTGGQMNVTQNLFMLKKRSGSAEYVSQSDFIRVATAEDYAMLDEDDATNVGVDTYNGERLRWEDLESEGWVGAYNSANPELSTAAVGTSPAGYYLSQVLVRTYDSREDAVTHAENVRIILDKFVERYNLLTEVFETDNPTEYPLGYEEITYS